MRSSQAEFERVRDYYINAIDENSHQSSVGIPHPSTNSERPVSAKMAYNDEQKQQYKNRN